MQRLRLPAAGTPHRARRSGSVIRAARARRKAAIASRASARLPAASVWAKSSDGMPAVSAKWVRMVPGTMFCAYRAASIEPSGGRQPAGGRSATRFSWPPATWAIRPSRAVLPEPGALVMKRDLRSAGSRSHAAISPSAFRLPLKVRRARSNYSAIPGLPGVPGGAAGWVPPAGWLSSSQVEYWIRVPSGGSL